MCVCVCVCVFIKFLKSFRETINEIIRRFIDLSIDVFPGNYITSVLFFFC